MSVKEKKVLLVEDHEPIWDFLSRRLRRAGYEVVVATDGGEGISKAREERPDVILLDMTMPVMDGWTAAGLIKADEGLRRTPIIALTAHAMADDATRTRQAGCDDYHPKPIDFGRLVGQIEALGAAA